MMIMIMIMMIMNVMKMIMMMLFFREREQSGGSGSLLRQQLQGELHMRRPLSVSPEHTSQDPTTRSRAPTSSCRPIGPFYFVFRVLRALELCDPCNGDWIVC